MRAGRMDDVGVYKGGLVIAIRCTTGRHLTQATGGSQYRAVARSQSLHGLGILLQFGPLERTRECNDLL